MTYAINGIGTQLCGVRLLTKEEIENWVEKFPFLPGRSISEYYIGTEAITIIFPVIPLKTYVFCYSQKGVFHSQYQILFYPPLGKPETYWPHVKNSLDFYLFPISFTILFVIWFVFFR